jgi:ABC-type transporter Mla MlaB component
VPTGTINPSTIINASIINASLRRIGPPQTRSVMALAPCQHRESSSASPRRLCVSRQRRPRLADAMSLLDVHVASCLRSCDDEPTSALILMSGELSASTIDDSVWSSVMEFAAFAHSVVLDLTYVDRVDQRGSEMVDALYRVVEGLDGELSLHNPSSVVEHVLRFCGISDRIVVCHPA